LSESELRVLRYLPSNLSAPGDRPRALPLAQHDQDAHAPHLREARRAPPYRGGRPCPRAGVARTLGPAPL